jgi:hypothetical protein
MKVDHFDPPGNNPDFAGNPDAAKGWTQWMSRRLDIAVNSVQAYLEAHGGGQCQFYNPLTSPRAEPDLPASAGSIPWNGFPRVMSSQGPGQPAKYKEIDSPVKSGVYRRQDEYLEWYVKRDGQDRITSVHFTCEAYDYFEFLAIAAPDVLLALYHKHVDPAVKEADLYRDGEYDSLNKWNTSLGALHLSHPANSLFAEVFLAASATVRRKKGEVEITASRPLIVCGEYGGVERNSDPAIGAAVNGLARDNRHLTLANPIGLYMASFNGNGLTVDGKPAGGFFKVVRGSFPLALRAVYELPDELVAKGLTVSDVKIGAAQVAYGGQLAERVTMHLVGIASVAQDVSNVPVSVCGGVPQAQGATVATSPGAKPQKPLPIRTAI